MVMLNIDGIKDFWQKHVDLLMEIDPPPSEEVLASMKSVFYSGASAAMLVAQNVSRSIMSPDERTKFWQGQIIHVEHYRKTQSEEKKHDKNNSH